MDEADILKYLKAERTIQVAAGGDISDFVKANDLLAVLKSGEAELIAGEGQTRIAIKPGTPLGIMRHLPEIGSGKVIAVTECELVPISEQEVATLVELNPRFARDLIGVLVETIRVFFKHVS